MHVRKPLLALCLALLVTTAGCNALGFGSETTPTPTTETTTTTETTETTTETTTTTTQNATSYPPGIAENGTVVNVSALANAHERLVLQRGAIIQMTRNISGAGENYSNATIEIQIATGGEAFYRDRQRVPGTFRRTSWATFSLEKSSAPGQRYRFENVTAASRVIHENGTTTSAPAWNGFLRPDRQTQSRRLHNSIEGADQSTVVETDVHNGVQYTKLRFVYRGEKGNTTILLNASEKGLIHRYERSGPHPMQIVNGTLTRTFELKQVGDVTIERPDWASKALNGSNDSNETSA